MMNRRTFIANVAVGSMALARAAAAYAQRIYRIGILIPGAATSDLVGREPQNAAVKALLRGLHENGLVYGEHFVTEARGGAVASRTIGLAPELVPLRADVIVAAGTKLPAIKHATTSIPVAMAASADPIAHEYALSLAHPAAISPGF